LLLLLLLLLLLCQWTTSWRQFTLMPSLNTAQKLQSMSEGPVCSEHLNNSAAVNNHHTAYIAL